MLLELSLIAEEPHPAGACRPRSSPHSPLSARSCTGQQGMQGMQGAKVAPYAPLSLSQPCESPLFPVTHAQKCFSSGPETSNGQASWPLRACTLNGVPCCFSLSFVFQVILLQGGKNGHLTLETCFGIETHNLVACTKINF